MECCGCDNVVGEHYVAQCREWTHLQRVARELLDDVPHLEEKESVQDVIDGLLSLHEARAIMRPYSSSSSAAAVTSPVKRSAHH